MTAGTLELPRDDGLHVAIIMDGNGRWAKGRGRRREWGHRQGAKAVRRVVEAAPNLGIGMLTLYAFSSDNWQRPDREVALLMKLFRRYLRTEIDELRHEGVRIQVIGRRDRLAPDLITSIESAERATEQGTRLILRLAVDYSSRDLMLEAIRRAADVEELGRETLAELIGEAMHAPEPAAEVDLLIRTGGEQRLSDFLLWECAYAELIFTPTMWPDFTGDDLSNALADYRRRERRFGRVAVAS